MSLNLVVTSRPAVRKPAGASAAAPAFAGFRNVARLPRCLNPAAACDSFMSVVRPTVVARAGVASAPKQVTNASMNIVFVSAEVSPWSKTGGLGDVVGGLPIELAKRGHKVMSITPRYDQYKEAWDTSVVINIMGEDVRFFHCRKEGVDRVFVDHPWFLAKVWGKTGSKLYGSRAGSDFSDNQIRFRLFCEAAIEACRCLPFGPGEDVMFVANDWHSALVPVMLKEVYKPRGEFGQAKCAFCVHNIAFQGRFWPETFGELRLPENCMGYFDFEDGYPKVFDENNPGDEDKKAKEEEDLGKLYKKVNWMKAGFLTSDKNVTVSPNYAMEVSTDDSKGVELNKTILAAGGIEGIVNGMDVKEWSPMKDKFLDMKYGPETVMQGKAAAKAALQAEAGLPPKAEVPLFGFIGRLEEQKGIDILLGSLGKWLSKGDAQLIVLGTGKKKLESMVKNLETKYPNAAKGIVKFSAPMAHYITAGADFMMVPSRFEPCGLIQLHAMQYGTVPVVASTGGLVDTVEEGVTGFQIGAMDPDDLVEEDTEAVATTAQRAIDCYGTPAYDAMVEHCINQDLSWSRPAKKWEALLEEVKMSKPGAVEKKSEVQTPVVQKKIQMASF